MNKLGQSTNLVLLVGVILATAISVFAVYSTFDDVVKSMVTGDPEIAARELTSYMDIAASSPNELTIYAPTPITIAGFPAYGTVLLNAEDQELRVHPYPQQLMQTQILKAMYGEISVGEVYSLSTLFNFRNSDLVMRSQRRLAGSIASDLGAAAARDQAYKEASEALAEDFFGNIDRIGREAIEASTRELAPLAARPFLDISTDLSTKIAQKQSKAIRVARQGGTKLGKLRRVASWVWPPSLARAAISGMDTVATKYGAHEMGERVAKKLERRAARKASEKANKAMQRAMGLSIALSVSGDVEEINCAIPTPPSQIYCKTSTILRKGIFMFFSIGEFVWTFWPIHHAILNSRDATEQIDNKFGAFKFHTGDIPIHVAVPNCENEPYVVNMNLPKAGVLGKIGLMDILGSQMNIPMSRSTDTIKTYSGITNQQDECFDAHNWYLEDGGFITELFTLEKYGITHPYTLGIAVPLAACIVVGLNKPEAGSTCVMMMEATLLGAWSNQEHSLGFDVNFERTDEPLVAFTTEGWKDNWRGNTFMATIVGIMLIPDKPPARKNFFASRNGAIAIGLYNLVPLDSQNLFSYISGADELIDGDKEYYMQSPLVIKISKEYDEEAEEYILVVDKSI